MPRVIVVGAGISGLTAAWRLQQLGHDVRVLESADHVGGKIATAQRDGFRLGRGAAVFAGSYTAFLGLVSELGLESHITHPPTTAGVIRDGRVHWLRGDGVGAVIDFARTPLISARSKLTLLKLAVDVVRARKAISYDDAAGRARIDTESVAEYCDRRLNAELRDHFISPLLSGIWVVDGGGMSVVDLFALVAKFLGAGMLGYRGGIDFLPRAIAERVNVTTGARVELVERFDDGARVVWTHDGEQHDERVDGVVLTVAAPDVPPMYPGLEPGLQGIMLEGLKQANYAVLRVALKRRPDIDGTFLAVPAGELTGIGTIAFEHNISPDVAPAGKGLIGLYVYADWWEQHRHHDDAELIDMLLPDLDRVIPGIADTIAFVEITSWNPATLHSERGTHKLIAQLDAAIDDDRRVQQAGDYLSVACIEGSVVAGEHAARRLSATLTPHPTHLTTARPGVIT
jgi:oxygen-dependent protoporphyrinogen oxidase